MNYDSNEYSFPVFQGVFVSEERKPNLVTSCFSRKEKIVFVFAKRCEVTRKK
jgi:hypothetical protein